MNESNKKKTVAIVCGGGPAPGINAVIAAVTLRARNVGFDVIGIYDGFSHLAKREKKYIKLTQDEVSRISIMGGSILHMSRYNPTKSADDLKNVVETLTELGVNYLVTIGGDDTAFSAAAVSSYAKEHGGAINVVHVPKTIDDDLPLPEGVPTFGFETAREMGAREATNLVEDARTSRNRWYFAVAMGRTAGHLALGIGSAAGADVTVIPEEFGAQKISLQRVVDIITGSIMKSYFNGKDHGVAVIAEGVIEKIEQTDLEKLGNVELDEHGHIRYSELDFGNILKKSVSRELKKYGKKITIVSKDIGYELRCSSPISYDIEYARSLGCEAVNFLAAGKSGAMISIQNESSEPMYFDDIKDPKTGKTKVRRVNTASLRYKVARDYMTRIEKSDLDNASLAETYDMTIDEFKKRFGYLFE